MAGNTFVRQGQLTAWGAAKAITFIEDAPLFSTADAPYFLSQASAVIQGEPEHALGKKRVFPNAVQTGAQEQHTRLFGGHALLPITIGSMSSMQKFEHFEIGQQAYHYFLGGSFNRDVFSSRWILARAQLQVWAEDYLRHFLFGRPLVA